MITSFIYLVLAGLGLGFLVFIHELGHYYVGRRVGMKIEVFSIGFGRPIYRWKRGDEDWQLCWLIFGGYVKFAGETGEEGLEPYEVPGGFYEKSPWARIQVAFAGPLVNILFALFVFSLIWLNGGREKSFFEESRFAGWVDPKSELYTKGVRPGDLITAYNGNPVNGAREHILGAMTAGDDLLVEGQHIDYENGTEKAFAYTITPYEDRMLFREGVRTSGVFQTANYLIYDRGLDGKETPLSAKSPMAQSGIQYGDRCVWVDGERIYSLSQQKRLLNEGRALLTVERNGKTFLARVPRVPIQELRLVGEQREELVDWQYDSHLETNRVRDLMYIPYNLSFNAVVEERIAFVDMDAEKEAFPDVYYSDRDQALQIGDRIIAVDGKAISEGPELLQALQTHQVHVIVERRPGNWDDKVSLSQAEEEFKSGLQDSNIDLLASSIGTDKTLKSAGTYVLLNPVTPTTRMNLFDTEEQKAEYMLAIRERKQMIEQMDNAEVRARAMESLEEDIQQLLLGYNVQTRRIIYNPGPIKQLTDVLSEMKQTLSALVMGDLSPAWMSGPVGIVHMMQYQWQLGIQAALHWLAIISLNLGILNLLPIPVLDGGNICLSIYEWVSRRRISAKTLERMIIPFAILLIGFFLFVTYHDLSRIVQMFVSG
ncbi:MAG: peptidase [Waddliaceae bacterium]|nr:peptidase [Waddliaceae bacterium]